jgi:hypothetical protein
VDDRQFLKEEARKVSKEYRYRNLDPVRIMIAKMEI